MDSYLSSILGQLFKMWPRVAVVFLPGCSLSMHNLQELSTTLPHLAKLSGVAKEFVDALMAKLITPLGTEYM